jgi:hypothetical protein
LSLIKEMERQFIDRLILIIGQEVNHLLDNDLAELQSITNNYLMNILFMLLIDLYFKLIVVNNWIISLVMITSFAYYLNDNYFRPLIVLLMNDLMNNFSDINFKTNLFLIYYSTLFVTFVANVFLLFIIRFNFEQIVVSKEWPTFDIYLFMFWIIRNKV